MREFDRGTLFSVFLKFFSKKIAEKFGEKKKVSTFAIPNESAGFGHQLRGWFFSAEDKERSLTRLIGKYKQVPRNNKIESVNSFRN